MNIYQRIILILGAIALAVAIWTTPKVVIRPGGGYMYYDYDVALNPHVYGPPVINPITASMRGGTVLGITVLIFLALKGIGKQK